MKHGADPGGMSTDERDERDVRNERDAAVRLQVGDRQKRLRRFWRSLPGAPRCTMCHRPFAGIGGSIMRMAGLGPWPGNPKYCRACFRDLYRRRAGAEVECSVLFADVRGSTRLAETMRPGDYRRFMDRFYETAFRVLIKHDAFVDKFVGDEVIGVFLPAMTDGRHARAALTAGMELLGATGRPDGETRVPVGIGVGFGVAYVGAVGTAEHVEFTALGDVVNVAARLSAAAGPGELLATEAVVHAAGMPVAGRERRRLDLKGKSEATDVVVLSAL